MLGDDPDIIFIFSRIDAYGLVVVFQDEVVPVSHSHLLLERARSAVEPLFIPQGSHNDLELFDEYETRLIEFIFSLTP
jgi:fermentation-respiration switch protein FrsA (DUF1100 family)